VIKSATTVVGKEIIIFTLPMTNFIIRFLNILVAAILAGVSLGIWIGFNPTGLSVTTFVEQQQNMLGALRVGMVSLVFAATVITLLSAIAQKNNRPVFVALLLAATLFIACILITRFGNKPIEDIMMTWTVASVPSNWTSFRDQWWTFHTMRTGTELIALVIITWTGIKKD